MDRLTSVVLLSVRIFHVLPLRHTRTERAGAGEHYMGICQEQMAVPQVAVQVRRLSFRDVSFPSAVQQACRYLKREVDPNGDRLPSQSAAAQSEKVDNIQYQWTELLVSREERGRRPAKNTRSSKTVVYARSIA